MGKPRISVILTAHSETSVSGPTMRSAEAAIAYAEALGVTVERVMGLDNPTNAARNYFLQPRFDLWHRHEVAFGNSGQARNALLEKSSGELVAFLDADDLFSENWLFEGVRILNEAEASSHRVIVHPELNWFFDGVHTVTKLIGQNDPLFSPRRYYTGNYYDTLCISPRAAHEDYPYAHRDIRSGLALEDLQFGVETMAGGWTHVIAHDTIIFKRKRDDSLVTEARARRAIARQLDCMAIDRIANLNVRARSDADAPTDS